MAKKNPNKTGKYGLSQEEKKFFGPVAIALGLTALLNVIPDLIHAYPTSWGEWSAPIFTIIAGLFLIALGFRIAPSKGREFKARILITAGASFIFVGTHLMSSCLVVGTTIAVCALIVLRVGLKLAPHRDATI